MKFRVSVVAAVEAFLFGIVLLLLAAEAGLA